MTKEIIIPRLDSPELAYLCGVLAGDGSISHRSHKYEWCIKCVGNPADEKEFYNIVIAPLFRSLFGIDVKPRLLDGGTTFGILLYSKEVVQFLTSVVGLPLGAKHPSLRIPKIFFKKRYLCLEFIRGVVDTDGCISFKKRHRKVPYYPVITISSKTSMFLEQIVGVLKACDMSLWYTLDYMSEDSRTVKGYTIKSYLNISGRKNLLIWLETIGFSNPKHLEKISRKGIALPNSGGRI